MGVDLTGTWPFNIQSKSYRNFSGAKVLEVLKNEMPDEEKINVLHVKITSKGEFVAMEKEWWYKIVDFINKTTNDGR